MWPSIFLGITGLLVAACATTYWAQPELPLSQRVLPAISWTCAAVALMLVCVACRSHMRLMTEANKAVKAAKAALVAYTRKTT